jgi:alpha-N-acetylglucosaminidase
MALHGINLPLAWVGAEKFIVEIFRELGLTDAEISTFLSGPSFQAWNRFGNIQGSWNGDLPLSWVDAQLSMNQQIVARMVELGMTPVLPSFTGFVPSAISRVLPNASVVVGSQFANFPAEFTNDHFLEPTDPNFTMLQKSFVAKQQAAYGNVSHIYTLDQFNENNPLSGDPDYLRNVSHGTWQSLKTADPDAIWMMQGWLFVANSAFWTNSLIEAWFSGVEVDSDMIVLDLFSESQPQWQRTNSYYGKPWIWCQLHDYGGNMGLYGQIFNVTINPIEALATSNSLVGFGLSMEGQEQENHIMYDLLLDQAWSATAIDTEQYFKNWVTTRYSGSMTVPKGLYNAWEAMRTTVYNNANLTSSAVTKSIFGLEPSKSGLTNRTGHHPTTISYDASVLIQAWHSFYGAAAQNIHLWENPVYLYDLVDITRQVIANEFITIYVNLVDIYSSSSASASALDSAGRKLLALLDTLDLVLSTNENFQLASWIDRAVARAEGNSSNAAFYEYEARNQITLWGPAGQISDYASKDWSGLVSTYYKPRWQMFVNYLQATPAASYNATALHGKLLDFELKWQQERTFMNLKKGAAADLKTVLAQMQQDWPSMFAI